MKNVIFSALTIYGMAFAISMGVAVLIKLLYLVVRRMSSSR